MRLPRYNPKCLVASAAVAVGSAGYIAELVALPQPVLIAVIVVALTGLAAWGIHESVLAAGIITDGVHTKAKIANITPKQIHAHLKHGNIVIVAGFQGETTDGRITTPLITDMPAVGKTPSMLAEDLKLQLSQYIQEPLVSVIVNKFAGTFSQQVRIVGATEKPASLPYRANMTLLDAMIAVGGLSEYAAGNKARLIRFDKGSGRQKEFALRLGDLLRKGDSRANVMLTPGDVIIIPESMF
mgnify:CR=1 FL=1